MPPSSGKNCQVIILNRITYSDLVDVFPDPVSYSRTLLAFLLLSFRGEESEKQVRLRKYIPLHYIQKTVTE